METQIQLLAKEFNQNETHVKNVVDLIDEGYTIPFIARYRKEMHGAMDDTTLRDLADRLSYLRNLAERREEIKKSIASQDKLTDELSRQIDEAKTLAVLEDLYRPYKQKRRTRATIAKEKGLEPLATRLFAQEKDLPAPETLAQQFYRPGEGRQHGGGGARGRFRYHRGGNLGRRCDPRKTPRRHRQKREGGFLRGQGGRLRLSPVLPV